MQLRALYGDNLRNWLNKELFIFL